MSKQENPQAFPKSSYAIERGVDNNMGDNGMSLRDYFAAKALIVIPFMAETVFQNASSWGEKEIAQEAYRLADAMLEARNQ